MEWINNLCGGRSCSTEEEKSTGNQCTICDIRMAKRPSEGKGNMPNCMQKTKPLKITSSRKSTEFSHKGAQEGNQRVLDEENR